MDDLRIIGASFGRNPALGSLTGVCKLYPQSTQWKVARGVQTGTATQARGASGFGGETVVLRGWAIVVGRTVGFCMCRWLGRAACAVQLA